MIKHDEMKRLMELNNNKIIELEKKIIDIDSQRTILLYKLELKIFKNNSDTNTYLPNDFIELDEKSTIFYSQRLWIHLQDLKKEMEILEYTLNYLDSIETE